jgi:hypothetical protein
MDSAERMVISNVWKQEEGAICEAHKAGNTAA